MAAWFRRDPRPETPRPAPVVPDTITTVGVDHHLAWRSSPTPGYHKFEYVPAGQDVTRFASMVLVELLEGGPTPGEAAVGQAHRMNEIDVPERDLPHAIRAGAHDGEVVLDFVVLASLPDGESVGEFAVYRYLPHPRGLVLFGYAERAYGYGVPGYVEGLAARRAAVVDDHTARPLPALG